MTDIDIGAWFLAGALGFIAHELTHYLTARALGRDAVIRWSRAETAYTASGVPDWRDRAIGAAPLVVGVALAPAVALAGGALPGIVAWLVYTFGGIPNDLRVRPRYRLPEWWAGAAEFKR